MSSQKRQKPSKTPQSDPNPSLPDELLLTCIARVSRLHYPTLSLVSKSFRSLLASPEFYRVRSLLDHDIHHTTESCLYVCLKLHDSKKASWFILCPKPDQTLTNKKKKKKSSGYVLVKAPIAHPPHTQLSSLLAVGSKIYDIGGSVSSPSAGVSILDCWSHTWRKGPNLPVKLMSSAATVLDGEIYVMGSYKDSNSNSLKNTSEVLNLKSKTWDTLSSSDLKEQNYSKSVVYQGKLHAVTDVTLVAYSSETCRWEHVQPLVKGLVGMFCEIRNVLYSFFYDCCLVWYDTKARSWELVKGLVGLPKFPCGSCVRLADHGGKMVVFWDQELPFSTKKMIWCGEIALKRRKTCEIWGKVEWFGHVLTVPKSYDIKLLSATV